VYGVLKPDQGHLPLHFSKMSQLRAVIIDDERYACERLKKLMFPFTRIEVTGYFTSSLKGLEYILKNKPEIIFLDVELENNASAFEFIESIDSHNYKPFIILVTAYTHYSIKAVKHHVFDYLLKPVDIDELRDTIERLLEKNSTAPKLVIPEFSGLSKRESDILNFILEGKNSREIADLLYISLNTVHTHRRNILKKTGARSVLDLIRMHAG